MKKIFTIIFIGGLFFLASHPAAAQIINAKTAGDFTNGVGVAAGFAPITIGKIIATVIQVVLSILALIFLILAVLSGFRWMTAAGNEEQIKKAQNTIQAAIIGLIIVLAAWAITYFIFMYLPFSGTASGGFQGGTSG
jgi:hypothetical protein